MVELLVVIAIVGLLISILLPSLAKAREHAKEAVCQSNQSQLVKTMFSFAHENDMDFPVGGTEYARYSQVIWGKSAYQNQDREDGDGWLPFGLLYLQNMSLNTYESWSCPARERSSKYYEAKRDRFPITETPWNDLNKSIQSDFLLRNSDDLGWGNQYKMKFSKLPQFENNFTTTSDHFATYEHWLRAHGEYGKTIFSKIDGAVHISRNAEVKNEVITNPNNYSSVSNTDIEEVWLILDDL